MTLAAHPLAVRTVAGRWPPRAAAPRPPSASRRPAFSVSRHRRQDRVAGRLQGQARGARMGQPRLPLCAQALRQRQHAGHAEERDGRRRGLAGDQLHRTPSHGDYLAPAQMAAWMQRAGRRADRDADGRRRHGRPRLRRPHHAAHVRRSTPRARWSMPAASTASPRANPADIEDARPTTSTRRWPRRWPASRSRTPATRAYGCSVKYADS